MLMIVAYLIIGVVVALRLGRKVLHRDSDNDDKGFTFLIYTFCWPLPVLGALIAALGKFVYRGK